MNLQIPPLVAVLIFPGGLTLIMAGLLYEWINRKLVAQYQNRVGPRWFQPLADVVKQLAKEEIAPEGADPFLFHLLPVVSLAAVMTAGLYVPMFGLLPISGFRGDLIAVLFLLSVVTMMLGLAGANTPNRFSLIGATRTLTQLFSYEAPFMLAMLGPAIMTGSWQIGEINQYIHLHPWMALLQPVGFVIAIIGLMGKLELPPFDAPEAETEIVSGALTEYSGRGLALFHIAKNVEMAISVTLVAAFYLDGITTPLAFLWKSAVLLVLLSGLQSLFARLRIDQTVGLWWRLGTLLALLQLLVIVLVW
ncbi:MAG: NADH-quinone oxidoreductase subunit H [Anaerolineaceae bacterium]|jgi:NADH-quinone oxidoreductase subunit H|nr:NADH-quinone oxidoreductase subunit H [Anaerolineaceae bacterium]